VFENLLCVVKGRKHVKLWHPGHRSRLYPGSDCFSTNEEAAMDAAAHLALHADLSAGDVLYIPCAWWHSVSSPVGECTISVSHWAHQPQHKLAYGLRGGSVLSNVLKT